MKYLVDAVQFLVISAIIYPMFYLWDTSQVNQFCQGVEKGMTKEVLFQLADTNQVKITDPKDDELPGKWRSSIITYSPLSNYSCVIAGRGNRVYDSWIIS